MRQYYCYYCGENTRSLITLEQGLRCAHCYSKALFEMTGSEKKDKGGKGGEILLDFQHKSYKKDLIIVTYVTDI